MKKVYRKFINMFKNVNKSPFLQQNLKNTNIDD